MFIAPDGVIVARNYLLAVTAVTGLVGSRIHSIIPREPTFPFVRLAAVGGGRDPYQDHRLERQLIDIHAFAAGDRDDGMDPEILARQVCATTYAALIDGCGFIDTAENAVLVDCSSINGPQSIPDETGGRPVPLRRFVATVELTLRNLP